MANVRRRTPFVKVMNGYGLTGMVLTLSLAQCQVLSAMYAAFSKVGDIDMVAPAILINDTLAFLKIFKDIESPIADGIWDEGYGPIDPDEQQG